MEMTKTDYRDLYNYAETVSNIGERVGDWLERALRKVTRSTIVILASIILGVIFFSLGIFGRKKKDE